MATPGSAERVRSVLAPLVTGHGFDLEDVTVTPAGRRKLLRVVVDRDGGVDLDAVAELGRAASRLLDDTDPLGGQPYVLEVSSPGVDRPLREPRHWRRAVGRLVVVETEEGRELSGRLVAADQESVTVETAGERRRLALGEVRRGRVQVEFAPASGG
jgi:ribosome maturation factor RimP